MVSCKASPAAAAPAAVAVEAVTFLDALRARYLLGAAGAKGCDELAGPLGGLSERDAHKQTHLNLLERVGLQEASVNDAGPPGAIREACPNIEELDLTGNPLGGWSVPLAVAGQLPKLRFLSLVQVPLPSPSPTGPAASAVKEAFGALRTLILNETGISFAGACELCAHLPQLEELQLSDHHVSLHSTPAHADTPDKLADLFPNLRVLLLENSGVTSWGHAWALRALPALEVLSLTNNAVGTLEYKVATSAPAEGDDCVSKVPFAKLKHLFLQQTGLEDWAHVDQARLFPALKELRLQDAPIVHNIGAAVARQLLVARVGQIEVLNGATISKRERDASERYYLRHLIDKYPEPLPEVPDGEWAPKLGDNWRPFLDANPRWMELVERHGVHSAQLPRTEGTKTLAMQLVNLTLTSAAGESIQAPSVTRKLPTSLQVSKLKLVCCQVFKLDPSKQRLFYKAPGSDKLALREDPGFMEELDDNMRQLAFYGIADGGTVVMNEWAPTQAEERL